MKKILLAFVSLLIWVLVGTLTIVVTTPIILYTLFFWWLDTRRRFQHRLATFWAQCVVRLNPFWKLQITGMEHFPKKQAFVAVSNHASLADIIILFCLARQFKWLAKESLFAIPFFGWGMHACGYIPLERGAHGSIRDSFEEAHQWLKRNMTVLFFPEGTRSREGHLGKFQNGAFKLALKTKRPILPIVISGSQNIVAKGKWMFAGRVLIQLHVLEPVDIGPYEPDHFEKLRDKVYALMTAKLAEQR